MKIIAILNIFFSAYLIFSPQGIYKKETADQQVSVWGDSRSGKETNTPNTINTFSIHQLTGPQPFISILCKFADVATQPKPLTYFKGMYSSAYPGLDNYWRELSYNKINLVGSDAVGWYTLPHDRAYYLSTSDYLYYIAKDCTDAADIVIDFEFFAGINLMLNADIDGYSYGGFCLCKLGGVQKNWPITWVPPWGWENTNVVVHEMGHAFGLRHSYGPYRDQYGNRWDMMSDYWVDCESATNKIYGCLGQSTIAYNKDILGWIGGRKYVATRRRAVIAIGRLEMPVPKTYLMAQISINGSETHFYTVEARDRVGYDKKLPRKAIVIHEISTNRVVPAALVGVISSIGDSFCKNKICIKIISITSAGFRVLVQTGLSED